MNYDTSNIVYPVTNDMFIKTVLILTVMAVWTTNIIDVKGALLHSQFNQNEEPIYMDITQVFDKYFQENYPLMLLKTLYGLNNVAYEFW